MRKLLAVLTACIALLGCSALNPVDVKSGTIHYESIIGEVWYMNGNLAAAIGEPTTYFTNTVEKWWFYRDSIVVIATHYDPNSLQALDQFKYFAEVGRIDLEYNDWAGDGWRSTETIWKVYARDYIGCGWTDVYSFTSPPVHLIVEADPYDENNICIGSEELCHHYQMAREPKELWYPDGWIGTLCGFEM